MGRGCRCAQLSSSAVYLAAPARAFQSLTYLQRISLFSFSILPSRLHHVYCLPELAPCAPERFFLGLSTFFEECSHRVSLSALSELQFRCNKVKCPAWVLQAASRHVPTDASSVDLFCWVQSQATCCCAAKTGGSGGARE